MQKFVGRVVDSKGAPVGQVSIQVNLAGSSAASIFSDNGVTAKANPFINNTNGTFEFYADDGRYDIVPSKTGLTLTPILDFSMVDPTATGDTVVFAFHIAVGATIPQNSTVFLGPHGHETADTLVGIRVPRNGTITKLICGSNTIPASGQVYTWTLMVSGVAQTLAVTHETGDGGSPPAAVGAIIVTEGARISVRLIVGATAGSLAGGSAVLLMEMG